MGVGNWIRWQRLAALAFARRFAGSTRGNVAIIFALSLPILVMMTMGGIDLSRASTVRVNLQDALDAASLAAARSPAVTNADLTTIGTQVLKANLQNYPDITLASATFTLSANQTVISNATVNVKTLVANIILPPYGKLMGDTIPVGAHSEVNRSSKNIEVGLVLDITGSMDAKLNDLKTAANQLVGIVVQKQQSPYYSRMAIVPYSIGVNMGSYAAGARGTPKGAISITGAAWTSGASLGINNISQASAGVVTTASSHGLANNDYVWISDVKGMTQLNDRAFRISRLSNTTFSLQSWNGSSWATVNTTSSNGYSAYSSNSSDAVRKCLVSDCTVVVTANDHQIPVTTTDTGVTIPGTVYLSDINGMTQINKRSFEVANVTPNTFSLVGVVGPNVSAYSSGGSAWCGRDGCEYRVFRRWSDNALTAVRISDCISERVGADAYKDNPLSSSLVGRNYAPSSNSCPTPTIQPLTPNIDTLNAKINSLAAGGSTGAQAGFAWGWYAVSPNFNSLWSGNPAGAYNSSETLKAVILMTDGEFNSPYCTGVIARDAANPGSGKSTDKINCDASNGSSYQQAAKLCEAMKLQQVVVYTVGFTVSAGSPGAQVLKDCATSPKHAFLPASGADLTDDFAEIGRDITRLRISK